MGDTGVETPGTEGLSTRQHVRMADTYTHGHHESVLRSHTWRTAENSAGYLLGSLEPGQRLLDVGCGPGTITLDLAQRVAPGEVLGIDRSDDVIAAATESARAADAQNVRFAVDDVYGLDLDNETFDVAHAHQVLQHLTDPVAALREIHRVLKPGGIVAVRDADYAGFVWAPEYPLIARWLELYHEVTERNGAEADAGRYLQAWVRAAGFRDLGVTTATWTFADPESRSWWGTLWADRSLMSGFADQAVEYGLADRTELEAIAASWRELGR